MKATPSAATPSTPLSATWSGTVPLGVATVAQLAPATPVRSATASAPPASAASDGAASPSGSAVSGAAE